MEGTIKKEEVDHFNGMAKDWWDKDNGGSKLLHKMNRIRVDHVVDGLFKTGQITEAAKSSAQPLKGKKILDVGCGGGILSEAFAEMGATVVAVDPATELIAIAEAHRADTNPELTIQYMSCTVEDLKETHVGAYDAVVASEVLDHVKNWQTLLRDCTKLVKPQGSVFISTINRTYIAWLTTIIFGEYVLGLVPKGTHHYSNFVTPEEVNQVFRECDFKPTRVRGSMYNPLTGQWNWSYLTAITYSIQAVRN